MRLFLPRDIGGPRLNESYRPCTLALTLMLAAQGAMAETSTLEGSAPVEPPTERYSCEYFDQFSTRAQQVVHPQSTCESILGDAGGFRSALADHGWGLQVTWNPSVLYDLKGQGRSPQEYGGQNVTWNQTWSIVFTYDLSRIGFTKDAQLTIAPNWQTSSYEDGNPHLHNISVFAISQPLLDGRLELQYGFYPLIRQFYGMVLGGNSGSAALGPTSVVPVEVGMSLNAPTPAFDVIVRDQSKRWYNHTAISRSMTPEGFRADSEKNPYGLKLRVDGANPILIDEFGYKVEAGPGTRSQWFRAGAIYNTTHYDYYKKAGQSDDNYGFYAANTVQLTQPHAGSAQGLYLDTKVNYAPPDRNPFAGDFQVTLFDIGLFDSRPADMTSLGFTRSFISRDLRDVIEAQGGHPTSVVNALQVSHAYRVTKGIYWINGLTYQDNPTIAPQRGDAFLYQSSLYFNF